MKKFLLTITITTTLLSSSITQCLSDAQQMALGILSATAALGAGIYVYHQNPSALSPEPNSEPEIPHNQQSQDKKQPKLIKDLKKSKVHETVSITEKKNTPAQEDLPKASFLTALVDRIREEETPRHFEDLLNDVAFEN